MATEDRTQEPQLIDPERVDLAIQAAALIGSMAGPMQALTSRVDGGESDVIHQLSIRIEQLSGVILSALEDDLADLESARLALLGPELYRQHQREGRRA